MCRYSEAAAAADHDDHDDDDDDGVSSRAEGLAEHRPHKWGYDDSDCCHNANHTPLDPRSTETPARLLYTNKLR